MKYLTIIFLSISFLNASMYLDTKNVCIEDFYSQNNVFYYLQSSNNLWYDVSIVETSQGTKGINNVATLQHGFIYDSINNLCLPPSSYSLGLKDTQFNFLLGLIGVIFGGVFLFFSVEAFVKVGGRR